MDTVRQIQEGKTAIGIEFGSTRIKAILVGESLAPIATGSFDWQNRLTDGIWTYSTQDIWQGLQACFRSLMQNVRETYGIALTTTASVGISAMMHGYLAFDENDTMLVPFRTWRNTMTGEAAAALTEHLGFPIPQRWSIAHLYHAILCHEPHLPRLRSLTTLAGYVHWCLTGERVLGIGDASGMFPIDSSTGSYNTNMLQACNALATANGFTQDIAKLLPQIIPVGECAGHLTAQGALLLDPTGTFLPGVPLCPPEGDAQTGMVATNSIAPKTCNVSAGTSIFAMAVLTHPLTAVHPEIDLVTTPCGDPVAMVHCNNCTGDIDAWVELFGGLLSRFGASVSKAELYDKLYEAALSGSPDCGGVLSCNYFSGEHVTGLSKGVPMLLRMPDAAFRFENLARSLIYTSMATLKIGMDILQKEEQIALDRITAHGGLFKSPITGQQFLAAALAVPVSLLASAGEGGAWGISLLASFCMRTDRSETLAMFLSERVFAAQCGTSIQPIPKEVAGFAAYTAHYKAALAAEKAAVYTLH